MSFSYAHLQQPHQASPRNSLISRIASWWVYALFALLFATNILLAIALYKSPNIADAISSNAELQIAAYENRIAHLRTELDRLHSRQHAKSGDLNLQLQELAAQQETLIEQHDYVRSLAEKAKSLGLELDVANANPQPTKTSALPENANIGEVTNRLNQMQSESLSALRAIAVSAEASSDTIARELKRAGLSTAWQTDAVGGPYVPARPNGADNSDHIDAANAAMSALSRFQKAKSSLQSAPIFRPVANGYSYSSRFGNRRDPFTGKQAFHSGLDFRAPSGTSVRAIGSGKVVFAGRRGGYGNLVEVKHPSGLISRYAHLSKISVSVGKPVSSRTVLGKVGSTGRSTGPHLHLEVRQNDKPLDPHRFIRVGAKLSKFL